MSSEKRLKAALQAHKNALRLQSEENERLRKAMRALLSEKGMNWGNDSILQNVDDYDEEMSLQTDDDDASANEENTDDRELPEPVHGDGNLYYCTTCMGEIEEGFCAFCGEEHQWFIDDSMQDSITTVSQAMHPDRGLKARGDTPLREIDTTEWEVPPVQYRSPRREEEYWELIRRGATPLMCKTFDLEFSPERGIYAWADDLLFDEFSGSLIKPGHSWKIHLGRRIALDVDDLDGSEFIEELLEEALYYAKDGAILLEKHERWETVQESPGLWVTRLQGPPKAEGSEEFEWDEYWAADVDDPFELEDKMLENPPPEETIMRPDEYSISDDDLEVEAETRDIGFFNPGGRDTVWLSEEEQVDELVDDDYDPENAEGIDGAEESAMDDDATLDDSDEPGSDFDSDEVLSGDEQFIR
ncbi:hypothetical protein CVT26_001269 [Gymnopilus dilepis]|uniref:DUF8191 domain-containing protein n=1 Tax=Gymnopilus dilepis TaxID=231916 RepID=A0A409Y1X6_9AGAR|nr:hypothetical protein CVT26_001269 [Gymnopilus dilepis]